MESITTFFISGYGTEGGTNRYHVLKIESGSKITCSAGNGTYFMVQNNQAASVFLVIVEFFKQVKITYSIV